MYLGEFRQSTAATLKIGPFVDATDGVTFVPSLTLSQADIRLSKNGGNIAQKNESSSCTYDEVGMYDCPIDATDTNTLGRVDAIVGESGTIPIRHFFKVITADEWDRKYATTGPVMDAGIKARGTTQSCTATGAVLASGEALPDDIVIGDMIALEVSAGNWVSRTITDSALTGDSVTYDTMVPAPTGNVRYKIFAGAPAGTADAGVIADAVWDEALSGHSTAGTGGKVLADAATAAALATVSGKVDTVDDLLDTEIASIVSTVATIAGYLDTEMAALTTAVGLIKAKTDLLTLAAIGQEVLLAMTMNRGNKLMIDGTDLVLLDTDGTTEVGRQPFTRLTAAAFPTDSVG